jgi:phosphoglycolate phosphatase
LFLKMKRKEYLFFDLDGTLTDPGLGITNSVRHALSFYGFAEEDREKLYPFIGPPLADSFEKYYGFDREKAFEAVMHFREYFSQRGIFENQVYPGVEELLKSLSDSGRKVVLATSKPEPYARRILEHFHLLPYFTQVCGATMDEKTRSEKKEVIAYALMQSGAEPSQTVMIGDRKYDVLAARELGLATVGVSYGYGSSEELKGAGCDRICHSVGELKELLEK